MAGLGGRLGGKHPVNDLSIENQFKKIYHLIFFNFFMLPSILVGSKYILLAMFVNFMLGCSDEYPDNNNECIWPDIENVDGVNIMKAETTIANYNCCIQHGKCTPPTYDYKSDEKYTWGQENIKLPINGLVFDQAQIFCEFLDMKIPTEENWESLAVVTSQSVYCSWENHYDCSAEYKTNKLQEPCSYVLDKTPISGICDLSGNLKEWTSDIILNDDKEFYIIKGGSFEDEELVYFGQKNYVEIQKTHWNLGLRCIEKIYREKRK